MHSARHRGATYNGGAPTIGSAPADPIGYTTANFASLCQYGTSFSGTGLVNIDVADYPAAFSTDGAGNPVVNGIFCSGGTSSSTEPTSAAPSP